MDAIIGYKVTDLRLEFYAVNIRIDGDRYVCDSHYEIGNHTAIYSGCLFWQENVIFIECIEARKAGA